jgi:hypothetical protein
VSSGAAPKSANPVVAPLARLAGAGSSRVTWEGGQRAARTEGGMIGNGKGL